MTHRTTSRPFFISLIVAILLGCGAAAPTKELVDARRAYDAAQQSPAAKLTPDKLLESKQALDRAEAAHNDDAGSRKEKALSYVAQRIAEQAMAYGEIAAARRSIASADDDLKKLQDELRRQAEKKAADTQAALTDNKAKLKNVREKLAEEGNKLSAAAEELKKKEAELKKQQQDLETQKREAEQRSKELAQKQQELEKEKVARLEAEKRVADLMASLKEIARVKEEARGMVITLDGSVLFASGKTALLPAARDSLGRVSRFLQEQDPNKKIMVEGHTDSIGTEENNRKLSQGRADAVREFLVSRGVEASRISAVGKGESEPVADNKSPEGRANNRRVEIIIK